MLFEDSLEKTIVPNVSDESERILYPNWLNASAIIGVITIIGSFIVGAFTENSLLGILFVMGWLGLWTTTRFARKFRGCCTITVRNKSAQDVAQVSPNQHYMLCGAEPENYLATGSLEAPIRRCGLLQILHQSPSVR